MESLIQRDHSPGQDATSAIILLNECRLEFEADGGLTIHTRKAFRIRNESGRAQAVATVAYDAGAQKIKSFQAWLVSPTGRVTRFDKKDAAEVALYSNARELYGEARASLISAKALAFSGDTFAFETTLEDHSDRTQFAWCFQDASPTESSSISITLPAHWSLRSMTFNHPPVQPLTSAETTTFQLGQLPGAEPEPYCPPLSAYAPWLAIDVLPPAGSKRRSYASWHDIAATFAPIYETAAAVDENVSTQAASLTASIGSKWEQIAALCRFVQQVRYISINLNSAESGGLIPRPAGRILQCNYGDCKDKTTLLRALLRSRGLPSYALLVHAGSADLIKSDWPSPVQFDHCIIAIPLDDSAPAFAAGVQDPVLGRLLIFDPTDPDVSVGHLAAAVIGGKGLLLAESTTQLLALPPDEPGLHAREQKITGTLGANGDLAGSLELHLREQAAAEARSNYRGRSQSDYLPWFQHWLFGSLPGVRLSNLHFEDDLISSGVNITATFQIYSYGKSMRDVLLVFKPFLSDSADTLELSDKDRIQPILVRAASVHSIVEIKVPDGYVVDEPFPSMNLQTVYGSFTTTTRQPDPGHQLFDCKLKVESNFIPPEKSEPMRDFFRKIRLTEQTPVVLKRAAN